MSNMEHIKSDMSIRMNKVNEDKRLEKMAKKNIDNMEKAVKILPQELMEHPNYVNYLLKYGAFTFQLNEKNANNYGKY